MLPNKQTGHVGVQEDNEKQNQGDQIQGRILKDEIKETGERKMTLLLKLLLLLV